MPTLAARPLTADGQAVDLDVGVIAEHARGGDDEVVSSLVVPVSSIATGASLTPLIVIVTVAAFESRSPSVAW